MSRWRVCVMERKVHNSQTTPLTVQDKWAPLRCADARLDALVCTSVDAEFKQPLAYVLQQNTGRV